MNSEKQFIENRLAEHRAAVVGNDEWERQRELDRTPSPKYESMVRRVIRKQKNQMLRRQAE